MYWYPFLIEIFPFRIQKNCLDGSPSLNIYSPFFMWTYLKNGTTIFAICSLILLKDKKFLYPFIDKSKLCKSYIFINLIKSIKLPIIKKFG